MARAIINMVGFRFLGEVNNSACSRVEVAMGVLGDVEADNGIDDGLHRCEGVFGVLSEDELHA